MNTSHVGRSAITALTLAAAVVVTGCFGDDNPYGPPYRDLFASVVGAYRPADQLFRPNPFLEGVFVPPNDGSDIRLSFGSSFTMGGRIFIPGGGPGGADLDERLAGRWEYDVPAQQIIVDFDPEVAISPPRVVFQITFLLDRIQLDATTDVAGIPLTLELAKPLPPESAPASGCANCPAFSVGGRR